MRAYLHACAPDEGAGATDEFACGRQELYSYAACRLFDVAPADAERLLSGRSSTARLLHAERELGSASVWLSHRMGLGDASAPPEVGGADDRKLTGLRSLLRLWGSD